MPFIDDEEPFATYIMKLARSGYWGGQLEMKALAELYRFNVIIHKTGSPPLAQVYHEPFDSVPTIHLAFHLERHYNSVRRADDPCLRGRRPQDEYPIGSDLTFVKEIKIKDDEASFDVVEDYLGEFTFLYDLNTGFDLYTHGKFKDSKDDKQIIKKIEEER